VTIRSPQESLASVEAYAPPPVEPSVAATGRRNGAVAAADVGLRQRPGVAIAVLALGGFAVSLTHTLVLPLLPVLPDLLGSSASATSWVATVTLLAGAVANPVVGRLGDMYGKRRMLLVSLTLLAAGSLVGALAQSLALLLVGRALQGLAIGVIPLGISILRDELPPDKVGGGIALVSATLGLGGGMGLLLSGLVADSLGWHALFWILLAVSSLTFALVAVVVPESPIRTPARFDLVGAIGLSATLLALLLVISKGADWGWTGPLTVGTLGAALLVGRAWIAWEHRQAAPVVDLVTTLRRPVLLTNVASVLIGFAMFCQFLTTIDLVTLPAATGHGFGRSILVAGLCQLPGALMMIAMSPLSARLSDARGPSLTLRAGSLLIAAGYIARMVLHAELWHLSVTAMVIYSGIGLAYGALPALIMANVPISETAAANAANALSRLVGASVGSATASAVLVSLTVTVAGETYPSAAAFLVLGAVGATAALGAAALARMIAVPEPR
jgi:MFS family permease